MVITEDGKLFPNVIDDKNLNYNDVIITDDHNDSVEMTRLSFEVFSLEKLWSFLGPKFFFRPIFFSDQHFFSDQNYFFYQIFLGLKSF